MPPRPLLLLSFISTLSLVFSPASEAATAPHPGRVIYEKLCLECHGDQGEGVVGKYDEPLIGDRSLEALARKIERTMPEDNEDACVGADAQQVATYMYEAFYSPAAQARNRPPEKDLTRLTISQYRTSVMDLIGRFRQGPGFDRPINAETGIKAIYRGFEIPAPEEKKPEPKLPELTKLEELKAAKAEEKLIAKARDALRKAEEKRLREQRELEEKKLKERKTFRFERTDGHIAFHFGADSPDKSKMVADQFNNRWDGSVVAEETGVYEFIVKSENGVRLWVNDDKKALIDAWVSAGPQVREEKKSIYLIGGRAYRLILEHFKFKEASASVELWWKPPFGIPEIIPQHALRTDRPQPLMIISTNFPADDRSVGYERGSSISKDWDRATTEAAITTAEHVSENLDRLAGTKPDAQDRNDKLKKFALTFVETAFRRPLTEEQKKLFVDSHFELAKSPDLAVKRIVLLALKSPRFLYPDLRENDQPDDYDVANRLALMLWDSLPDKKLTQAAAEKKLHTRDQVKTQAWRMVSDPRTKAKLHGFFHHWLDLEHAENTAKDPKAFPAFTQDVLADLRQSLLQFIDQVVWSDKSDYRELLRADYILLNGRLAKVYGQNVQGEEFQKVGFDPKQRAGIVTHPYLLASMAYSKQTSPIHRGVFLTRNIVGMSLKSPPMAVAFDESHFDPTLTMREKITELTKNNTCMSCHASINPLGFSLENFDAIGRWRTQDNNKPVNSTTDFATEEGKTIRLTGPRDIVNYVADNPAGHRAFIRNLFHHTVKQQIPAYGLHAMEELQRGFANSGCNIKQLLVDIVLTATLDGVPAESPPASKPKPSPTQAKPATTAAKPAPTPAAKPTSLPAPTQSVVKPTPAPADNPPSATSSPKPAPAAPTAAKPDLPAPPAPPKALPPASAAPQPKLTAAPASAATPANDLVK
ncbi:Cytochrome C oxidase, cbb3-type, subunit III [Prosthecobacter debontii]|uniref:Cytochrome C oxidase, cbb3-type, subunit III n=1 Tax=Prosthecobacter debontii TaxID=48467 RepID=A0A1T4XFF6_9BACT|nr:DUF1592 domain-containing protein [Prosthecobacter debontii]SKA88199.1 Cytochrome C oxidase, cbb3-type, subunit III [Prosthecobacter debontii]